MVVVRQVLAQLGGQHQRVVGRSTVVRCAALCRLDSKLPFVNTYRVDARIFHDVTDKCVHQRQRLRGIKTALPTSQSKRKLQVPRGFIPKYCALVALQPCADCLPRGDTFRHRHKIFQAHHLSNRGLFDAKPCRCKNRGSCVLGIYRLYDHFGPRPCAGSGYELQARSGQDHQHIAASRGKYSLAPRCALGQQESKHEGHHVCPSQNKHDPGRVVGPCNGSVRIHH
mmetsp:Transcript_142/g.192  ORF Transcript_142/g.192 Transcript_142/m.192 type:complete len:226 (+) Transcript_142:553-1230(+)